MVCSDLRYDPRPASLVVCSFSNSRTLALLSNDVCPPMKASGALRVPCRPETRLFSPIPPELTTAYPPVGSAVGAASSDYVEETSVERVLRMFYTGLFGVLYTMSKVRSTRSGPRCAEGVGNARGRENTS